MQWIAIELVCHPLRHLWNLLIKWHSTLKKTTKQKHTNKQTNKKGKTKCNKQAKPKKIPKQNKEKEAPQQKQIHTNSNTDPTVPCSLNAWAPAEDEQAPQLIAFTFPNTLSHLKSLPEARTVVQNVHSYVLLVRHQAGTSLLVLSIYFDRDWEVYNEWLCFLTLYEAPTCQGYFYSQCLTVWCWIQSSSQTSI